MWSAPEDDEEKGKREAGGGRKGTRRKSERGEMVEEGMRACVCAFPQIYLSLVVYFSVCRLLRNNTKTDSLLLCDF